MFQQLRKKATIQDKASVTNYFACKKINLKKPYTSGNKTKATIKYKGMEQTEKLRNKKKQNETKKHRVHLRILKQFKQEVSAFIAKMYTILLTVTTH